MSIKDVPLIYLDHNVWCGIAGDTKYSFLKQLLEAAIVQKKIVVPYSMVHIQELAETGKTTNTSKSERLSRVSENLEFIKRISGSLILAANELYTSFELRQRDPFEAFNTFTEVELKSASTNVFINLIPTAMVKDIRNHFELKTIELNNMKEEDAIEEINRGIKTFIERYNGNEDFRKHILEESAQNARTLVIDLNTMVKKTITESLQLTLKGYEVEGITISEKESLDYLVNYYKDELIKNDSKLEADILSAQESSAKSVQNGIENYSFEMMLELICEIEKIKNLPKSFYKQFLLNFFGFNSKLSNRTSDYYDLQHSQYLPVCRYFVTEDGGFQRRLGGINNFVEKRCQILSVDGFQLMLQAL